MAWEFNPFTVNLDKTATGATQSVTLQPDVGTSPVGDVFTLTSSDGSVTITGNAATDTVDFKSVSPALSVVTIINTASPYATLVTTDVLFVNAAGGAMTINIHALASATKALKIVRTDTSANVVTLDPSGAQQIIDNNGVAQATITLGARQGLTLVPSVTESIWFRS